MDTQQVLDTALTAGAATLGCAEASQIFRSNLKNSIKCQYNLLPRQRAQVQDMCDFPIVFVGGTPVTNDHPVFVTVRGLCRDIYEAQFHIERTFERTLIVGACHREISKYNANPYIHYYLHGSDNKDYDRIIRPALIQINKQLKQKSMKSNKKVFLPPDPLLNTGKMRPCVKRYHLFQEIFKDYMELKKMPANIHTYPITANTLCFEDSIYNLGEKGIVNLFKETGAQTGYGYGVFPMELLFPDMAPNPNYSVRSEGDYTSLVFNSGYCNGYRHRTEDWSAILRKPVLSYKGLNVGIEITSRIGFMCVFKLYVCKHPETIVRSISLKSNETFVRVLDVYESVDRKTGKACKPLSYFSVREDEMFDTINYLLSLDSKSISFTNCVTYVRRRMGGMSLVTKELLAPWHLEKSKVFSFCLTLTLLVKCNIEIKDKVLLNLDIGSVWDKFKRWFSVAMHYACYPISELLRWIYLGNLEDRLVLYPTKTSFQKVQINIKNWKLTDRTKISSNLYCDNPNEEEIPTCQICFALMGRLGQQEIKCEHKDKSEFVLELTDQQVKDFKTVLIDNDNDPPGLKSVKERAAKCMPTTGFTHKVNIFNISAGPGCGKSYLIRKLATEADLVLAPFTKLKPDYEGITADNGDTINLNFKTNHRAMETTGAKNIFVDEWTSLPYEFLACVAYRNCAENIYLVGDEKQTKVQEPTEGMFIGNYIDLTKASRHTLLVNFRNPKDTVAMLNRIYGYEMKAFSKIERSIEVVDIAELPKVPKATKMCFSKASSVAFTETDTNTVRKNQGGTCKVAILHINSLDNKLLSIEDLQIVALSRHTEKLYIVTDKCPEAEVFVANLKMDTDFYDHMQTWLHFPNEAVKPLLIEDKSVELVVNEPHPPSDSYLLTDTLLPGAATADGVSTLNLHASQYVIDRFANGKTTADQILVPTNKRKHPIDLRETYLSIGQGVGNRFSSKIPMQTLAVMNARYANKQPFYQFGVNEQILATQIVDLWFEEHVDKSKLREVWDDGRIQDCTNSFLKHINGRNYAQSFKGNGGFDDPTARDIRFSLKSIFKPKHNAIDPYKAGQGISAWSQSACAMFCNCYRLITSIISEIEKPHVVTDVYLTEQQFLSKVKLQFSLIPYTALNAITDGEMFDANQNEFTQAIEQAFLRKLGISDDFINMYYSFRKKYKIVSSYMFAIAGTQKTSGEPGTLVNNGIVSKTISNYIIRGEGPCAIVYKGDDFAKRQCNLAVQQENLNKINAACALKLKINIGEGAEFCGLIVYKSVIFPSIPRKLNKITGHSFKDYKHFTQYQEALRDWVKAINKTYGAMSVIGANAALYKCTFEEMEVVFHCIDSWSHVNEKQFLELAKKRVEVAGIPYMHANGNTYISDAADLVDSVVENATKPQTRLTNLDVQMLTTFINESTKQKTDKEKKSKRLIKETIRLNSRKLPSTSSFSLE